jgi:YVTN family beta-propeller protein
MRWLALALVAFTGCTVKPPLPTGPESSSTIALTTDDRELWVVNPDADSVTVIDPSTRTRVTEIPLGPAPSVDATTNRFDPAVLPRALAILPSGNKVYVAGQRANRVFVIDRSSRAVKTTVDVGAEPTAVVASAKGDFVYVVSHQAALVTKIDVKTDAVVATLPVAEHPFGASVSADGASLYVTHFLLHAGVTTVDTATFTVRSALELAKQEPDTTNGKLVPNGLARGVYAAVPRPTGADVWLPHLLLAVDTPEPALDFQSTVFPTVSTLVPDGSAEGPRLLFKPITLPGVDGSFSDVVSGPRAIAFSPDGALALVVNTGSEDVLVLDGETGNERALVRPLPATMPEGVVVDHAGRYAYVQGRNSHNVVVLSLAPDDPIVPVAVEGDPIDLLSADPMPARLRLGQRLFYSANSSALPITQNFWVSCSSCHLEGGTDAVTWLFTVGPRDTPSNAGGPINTGFLLRQALRNSIADYDTTIDVEQGGRFHRDNAMQKDLLDALADYVNYAIALPQNPNLASDDSLTDAQQRGRATFQAACASCHTGAWLTDSGVGNPTLDLAGPIMLHDIGTCVKTGTVLDQPAADEVVGKMHTACDFDTPTLRGIFATPPYFHDGSAATLDDVVNRLPASANLGAQEKADLVAYIKTL